MNFTSILKDFDWVISILESSKTKGHMHCATKCFLLWEKKYTSNSIREEELKSINKLKSTFWSIFKSKRFTYDESSNIQK
jgi:hypothetical protein